MAASIVLFLLVLGWMGNVQGADGAPNITDPTGDAAGLDHLDITSAGFSEDGSKLYAWVGVRALREDPDPNKMNLRHQWQFHFVLNDTSFTRHFALQTQICTDSNNSPLPPSPDTAHFIGTTVWKGSADGNATITNMAKVTDGTVQTSLDLAANKVRFTMDFSVPRNEPARAQDMATSARIIDAWAATYNGTIPLPCSSWTLVDLADDYVVPYRMLWEGQAPTTGDNDTTEPSGNSTTSPVNTTGASNTTNLSNVTDTGNGTDGGTGKEAGGAGAPSPAPWAVIATVFAAAVVLTRRRGR